MKPINEDEVKKFTFDHTPCNYDVDKLKLLEDLLIDIIKSTRHYTALENLTQALCKVRYCNSCLDLSGKNFYT